MFKKIFGNFDFGPVKNSEKFRMSPYGIAMRQKDGSWVCYNTKTDTVTNVADMVFKMDDMFYQIPVNTVKEGDLIVHKGEPVYVKEVLNPVENKGRRISCYHVERNEEIIIYPEKSIMGNFLFFSKIVSIMNLMGISEDNPNSMDFTKMNPMMMMLMGGNDSDGGMFGGKFKDIMMMQMMGGMFNGEMDGSNINQILPFLMFSGNQDMDMFEMMMMMQLFNNNSGTSIENSQNNMGNMFGTMFSTPKDEVTPKTKKPTKK